MIMGLGLVFYGMGVMGEAMTPLRSYQPFLDLMVRMESPLLGILVGTVFTALVQSSAATTGIAIVMAAKDDVRRLSEEFLSHQSERIGIQTETHLHLVRLELELLDKLRRIYTLAKRIAKDQVPEEVARRA